MAAFTDALDRSWKVDLFLPHLADLRALGYDLVSEDEATRKRLASILFDQPEELVKVLWVLVGEQAQAAGIDQRAFAKGFNGEALGNAGEALAQAVADFSPRRKIAQARKAQLPAILTALDEAAAREITRAAAALISKAGAGTSPDSSGSTPPA